MSFWILCDFPEALKHTCRKAGGCLGCSFIMKFTCGFCQLTFLTSGAAGILALTFTKVTLTRVVIVFFCDSRSVSRNRWHSNKQGGGRPSDCFTAVRLEKFLNPPSTAELRRRKTVFSFQESFAGLPPCWLESVALSKRPDLRPAFPAFSPQPLLSSYPIRPHWTQLVRAVFRWMHLLHLITKQIVSSFHSNITKSALYFH